MAAGTGASGLASTSASGSGTSLHALTSMDHQQQQQQQRTKTHPVTNTGDGEREITQAVQEEDMGLASNGAGVEEPTYASASHLNADSSAIADSSSSSSSEDENTVEMQRTGHAKLRQGSRRLSRMSSTLGEGATAHWRRPSSSSTGAGVAGASGGVSSPLSRPSMTASSTTSPPAPATAKEVSLPPAIASRKLSPRAQSQTQSEGKNSKKLSPIEYAKRMAAHRAVDAHVKEHHRVIGIGSGSTVPYVVERILEMGEKANKRRWVSAF